MRHIFDLPTPVNRQRHEGAQGLGLNAGQSRPAFDTLDISPIRTEEAAALAAAACSETHDSPGKLTVRSVRSARLGSAVPWIVLWGGGGHLHLALPHKGWRSRKATDVNVQKAHRKI